jgi:hypothetical protein
VKFKYSKLSVGMVLAAFGLLLAANSASADEGFLMTDDAANAYRYTLHLSGKPVRFSLTAAIASPVDAAGIHFSAAARQPGQPSAIEPGRNFRLSASDRQ